MIDFLTNALSVYHASDYIIKKLNETGGFTELKTEEAWKLEPGHGYYVCPFGTTVIAFRTGSAAASAGMSDKQDKLRIIASHTDHPGFRVKENPEVKQGSYVKLNVESYGGAILNTWLDRPLGAAGCAWVRGKDGRAAKFLVDFDGPAFVIPNVAIHMNRKINEGIELNKQIDMLPLAYAQEVHAQETHALNDSNEKGYSFREELAYHIHRIHNVSVKPEDILSYDISIYNAEKPVYVGRDRELLMAGGIDNVSSEKACLDAITGIEDNKGIIISAFFDHEEVGSRSKNGADSSMLANIIERICISLGHDRNEYLAMVMNGEFLSLDVAHANNPNHPEKYDPTSGVSLGSGVTIKCSSRQNYCTDADMTAQLLELAGNNGVKCSVNYLRSDIPGGSTIGSILSSHLPMRSADIGIPILAMHSAMETMSVSDQRNLDRLAAAFLAQH